MLTHIYLIIFSSTYVVLLVNNVIGSFYHAGLLRLHCNLTPQTFIIGLVVIAFYMLSMRPVYYFTLILQFKFVLKLPPFQSVSCSVIQHQSIGQVWWCLIFSLYVFVWRVLTVWHVQVVMWLFICYEVHLQYHYQDIIPNT